MGATSAPHASRPVPPASSGTCASIGTRRRRRSPHAGSPAVSHGSSVRTARERAPSADGGSGARKHKGFRTGPAARTEPPAVERRPGDSMYPAARVFPEEPDLCAGRGLVVAALLLLHAFDDGESEHDGSSCRGHSHAHHIRKCDDGRRFAYVISGGGGRGNGYVLRLAVALHRFRSRSVCALAIAGLVRRLDDLCSDGTEPTT